MTPQNTPPSAQKVRLIHGALAAGMVLFAVVAHFLLLPKASPTDGLGSLLPVTITVSLALIAIAFVISTRVPRSSPGESTDAFWVRAAQIALIAWSALEGAALLAIVVYSHTGSTAELAVAIFVVAIFLLMNPGYFERRN